MPEPRPMDRLLDALVDSYDPPSPFNNLATAALPNRRAVLQAYQHLQHVLFLGFFTTRPVERELLRWALAEHLLPAHELLTTQVARAAAWADRGLPGEGRRCEGWCRETVQEVLNELPALRAALQEDALAAYRADPAAESPEEVVYSYPGLRAVAAHRVAHAFYQRDVPLIPRILSEFAHEKTGIDLHPGARIGRRFFIDHGTGVVVGATTVIGDDVKLYQGVTLGAHSVRGDLPRDRASVVQRHPTLQDRVTVYAGATILGGSTVVGADSVIGGNVWLTTSVPPGSKVFYRSEG